MINDDTLRYSMLIRLRDVSHVNEWRDAKTPSCVVAEMVNNLYLWKSDAVKLREVDKVCHNDWIERLL